MKQWALLMTMLGGAGLGLLWKASRADDVAPSHMEARDSAPETGPDARPVIPDLPRRDSAPAPQVIPLPAGPEETQATPPLREERGDEVAEVQRAQDDYVLMVQGRVQRLLDEGKVALDPADAVEATEFERKTLDVYGEAWVLEDLTDEEYNLALVELLGKERAETYRAAAKEAGKVLAAEFYNNEQY